MITTRNQSRAMPATRDQLREVPLVRPENAGRIWKGVQHGQLVDTIDACLQARGVEVTGESWHLKGPQSQCLAGSMQLNIPGLDAPEGTAFALGLLHGNDMSRAMRIAVGLSVFVCHNGMVTGDFLVKRRHTLGFDAGDVVSGAVDRYLVQAREVSGTVDRMKARDFYFCTEVDRTLMRAGREGLMPWSRIGQVDAEYNHPTFSDHAERTAWGLYNAFTYIAQKSPAGRQIDMMSRFKDLVLSN